jgi:hypothetical protein
MDEAISFSQAMDTAGGDISFANPDPNLQDLLNFGDGEVSASALASNSVSEKRESLYFVSQSQV